MDDKELKKLAEIALLMINVSSGGLQLATKVAGLARESMLAHGAVPVPKWKLRPRAVDVWELIKEIDGAERIPANRGAGNTGKQMMIYSPADG
jgi:hypothetical protein